MATTARGDDRTLMERAVAVEEMNRDFERLHAGAMPRTVGVRDLFTSFPEWTESKTCL